MSYKKNKTSYDSRKETGRGVEVEVRGTGRK